MAIMPEIEKIEAGLKDAGATVRALCVRAEINPSTWTRWKSGNNSPNTATWAKVQAAYAEMERTAP